MDNWDDYKFVAALAHFKSMSAAAKHLHTNIATVSRRIHRLTESSGITIFNKDKDGWVLTPTGQELLDVISNFEEGLRRITSSQVSVTAKPVTIRLSTIEYLASSYIAPELGSLASEHPNVSLDFMCSDHTLSLAYGEADIAVRLNRPEEGRLVSRKIADIPYSVFQNPDSSHKAWIGLSEDLDWLPEQQEGFRRFKCAPIMRVPSFAAIARAADATGFACILPNRIPPRTTNLRVTMDGLNCVSREIWTVFHETRREDKAVRLVLDWLKECFTKMDLQPRGEHFSVFGKVAVQ